MKIKYILAEVGMMLFEGEGETPRIGELIHFIPTGMSYRVKDIKRILKAGPVSKTLQDEGEVEVTIRYEKD